jgi:hypothetical protein
MLLKVAIRAVRLQFHALCVYLLCEWIAGPKNAVLWFATVLPVLWALFPFREDHRSHFVVVVSVGPGGFGAAVTAFSGGSVD